MSTATATLDVETDRLAIRPDSLAQSIVLLLSITVVQRAVGFGRSILLCRWLAPEELGYWDLTLAFFDLAAPIAVLSLPACFPRYVEQFRRNSQLRTFMRHTVAAILILLLFSTAVMFAGRGWLSQMLYNQIGNIPLISLVIVGLPTVVVFNVVNELFCGLRQFRIVSKLHFMQSILFAALALSLAGTWHAGAGSVVAAYCLTCAVCSILPCYWLVRMWQALPQGGAALQRRALWEKLLPFAGAVWMSNLLGNLFMMSDRYMILHYSGWTAADATAAVGQYHSARVVPLLIVQLSGVIGTMFVPFFSHDWEAGRRAIVRARLNIFLKVVGLALTAAAILILTASPVLFTGVFGNKFAAGQAILPWTLLCAMWYSLFCIARSYLWCDERVWLVNTSLVIGLAVNIGANWFLLPWWGIQGAAVSASLANMMLLGAIYGVAICRGMTITPGTWLMSALPAAICLGPWLATLVIVGVVIVSATTPLIFNREEKAQLTSFARDAVFRLQSLGTRRLGTTAVSKEP